MEKKKERQYASGHNKREKRKKREECKTQLRVAMSKYVKRSEGNLSNSEDLPAVDNEKCTSVLEEENIGIDICITEKEKIPTEFECDQEINCRGNICDSKESPCIQEEKSEDGSKGVTEETIEVKTFNNAISSEVCSPEEEEVQITEFHSGCEEEQTFKKESICDSKQLSLFSDEEKIKTSEEIDCESEEGLVFKQKSNCSSEDLFFIPEYNSTQDEIPGNNPICNKENMCDNFNDPALWPPITDSLREHFIHSKPNQNISYLDSSKKMIGKNERTCSKTNFFRQKKNGEIVNREWLIYSPSAKAVFCFICKLYGSSDQALCKSGFSDWRNIVKRLSSHENSDFHRKCMYAFSERSNAATRIDNSLVLQYKTECDYWKKILHRVVAVLKFISQRGLACFGDNETFGSMHNGNFLGILELLSKFDPFLADHINSYGNKGRGNVNYLSSTVVTELIEIMSKKVLKEIVSEIQEAKYFGLIVDSTPDISHVDQLSVVLRYINKGEPVERFLTFIQIHNHTSQHLQDVIMNFFQHINIQLKYCRGQSFDNASNMSGKYTGLQARLKKDFPLIYYVPCSAHSLNLVGTSAAECCHTAVSFFGTVQSLYNFFAASTHRWQLLTEKIFSEGRPLSLKSLSVTRWSANADAVKALRKNYKIIIEVLDQISNSEDENASTRHDAKSLHLKISTFECALLTVIWDKILQRMNSASKTIQSENCKVQAIVPLYNSLIKFVNSVRDTFDEMENEAHALIGFREYKISRPRKVPRSRMLDESSSTSVEFSGRQQFLHEVHYVICDSLITELNKRKCAYDALESIFGFMCNDNLTNAQIKECAKDFQNIYSADIEDEFPDEFWQFKEFVSKDLQPTEKLKLIKSLNIEQTFPNVETALRIMLSIPLTNCSSERSFSALKRIKNRMRSTLSDSKVSGLALLSIESDVTEKINFDDVIDDFAKLKSRKKPM